MNDSGYTLIEMSASITIALIIFISSISFVRFAERLVNDSIDNAMSNLELTYHSQRIATDLRDARAVSELLDGYKIIGQNNEVVMYSHTSGMVYRNAVRLGSSLVVDSLVFELPPTTEANFVKYRLYAKQKRNVTFQLVSTSGVVVRGAPVWPGVEIDD
ncbi:MAG: prepilin-type N-terminal cleavage/methylation domain-containing protein [Rhodothermales bacterium]|nr:prepilin-type N-terminal cleavage/methylation domain-containing protein [Rhodothermales bacterium]